MPLFPDTPQIRGYQDQHVTVVEMRHYDGAIYYGLFKNLNGVKYYREFMEVLTFALQTPRHERGKFNFLDRGLAKLKPNLVKGLAIAQVNLIAILDEDEAHDLVELIRHFNGTNQLEEEVFLPDHMDQVDVRIVRKRSLSLVRATENNMARFAIFEPLSRLDKPKDWAKTIGVEVLDSQKSNKTLDLIGWIDFVPGKDAELVRDLAVAQSSFVTIINPDEAKSIMETLAGFQFSHPD